jgi:hypothetical protein
MLIPENEHMLRVYQASGVVSKYGMFQGPLHTHDPELISHHPECVLDEFPSTYQLPINNGVSIRIQSRHF